MFEVVYIAPSSKQAKRFIYDIMEKLKSGGIINFEVDVKNLQFKTDKFIITAVDIWCGKLGRSYERVKYFIDGVSTDKFTGEVSLRILKVLKSNFRETTREVSEEELIKILMEN